MLRITLMRGAFGRSGAAVCARQALLLEKLQLYCRTDLFELGSRLARTLQRLRAKMRSIDFYNLCRRSFGMVGGMVGLFVSARASLMMARPDGEALRTHM